VPFHIVAAGGTLADGYVFIPRAKIVTLFEVALKQV